MSNIREVAKIAGVSVATVSRALSHPEKVSEASIEKVKRAIEQVNYRPNMLARNFRSAKSYSLVVLVPDISNPFFSMLIRGVESEAQSRGYSVLLGDTKDSSDREKQYLRLVETRLADGIIQMRAQEPEGTPDSELNLPYVNLCSSRSKTGPCIRIDNAGAMKNIVEHLISFGHKRIGIITGHLKHPHTTDRLNGYKVALAEAGITYDDSIVIEGEYTIVSGVSAAEKICQQANPPSAVVCMNDEMAIGAMQTFKQNGLEIPRDISVTGFDNIEYSQYCDPTLTTVSQPAMEMGKVAVDALLKIIDGEKLAEVEYVLDHEFILRDSTGPAPK